jgi:bifunctional non-homologous end joining protein LigD
MKPLLRPATSDLEIPRNVDDLTLRVGSVPVKLTHLQKVFWPNLRLTKRDLLQYYVDVSPWLLPHLKNRAMVMKRYPNGIAGEFFFMKRAPSPRPSSIPICSIEHSSGNVIGFPVIQHLASLLWVVNLGCIDLNPWYARCGDVHRPDYLHFDLDPVEGTSFERVLETALIVRDALAELKIPSYAKTTGSRGIHVYVPIARGPLQKQVWEFAKVFPRKSRSGIRKSLRPSIVWRSAQLGTSLSITTRMRGTARWHRCIQCGRNPPRPFRRPSPGRK